MQIVEKRVEKTSGGRRGEAIDERVGSCWNAACSHSLKTCPLTKPLPRTERQKPTEKLMWEGTAGGRGGEGGGEGREGRGGEGGKQLTALLESIQRGTASLTSCI